MKSRQRHSDEAMIDLLGHIRSVSDNLSLITVELMTRASIHDASKFDSAEFERLVDLRLFQEKKGHAKFGTPQYEEQKIILGPMLDHHYASNSHHPEHYDNGVAGMTLMDLVEMFCDWRAASFRDGEDDPVMNLQFLAEKYDIPLMLVSILANTAEHFDWRHNISRAKTVNACVDKNVVCQKEAALVKEIKELLQTGEHKRGAPYTGKLNIHLRDRLYLLYQHRYKNRVHWCPEDYPQLIDSICEQDAENMYFVIVATQDRLMLFEYLNMLVGNYTNLARYLLEHRDKYVGMLLLRVEDKHLFSGTVRDVLLDEDFLLGL